MWTTWYNSVITHGTSRAVWLVFKKSNSRPESLVIPSKDSPRRNLETRVSLRSRIQIQNAVRPSEYPLRKENNPAKLK